MKKSALITGGSKRIGKSIAVSLANKGYDIAIAYNTSASEAFETKTEIEQIGGECSLYKCDLANPCETEQLLDTVHSDYPHLSLLVNNASIFTRKSIKETDKKLLIDTFTVNAISPYILTNRFASLFKEGNIINIIDAKTVKNGYNYSAYMLSKKTLMDLTLQSAAELGPEIRVNGIAPGFILPPDGECSTYFEKLADKTPLKKMGGTEEITNALFFLLENSFITGQIIFVDGGQHIVTGE